MIRILPTGWAISPFFAFMKLKSKEENIVSQSFNPDNEPGATTVIERLDALQFQIMDQNEALEQMLLKVTQTSNNNTHEEQNDKNMLLIQLEDTQTRRKTFKKDNRRIGPGLPPTKSLRADTASVRELMRREVGESASNFIEEHVDLMNDDTYISSTTTPFNLEQLPAGHYQHIVNLKRINDIRRINKFFEAVNEKIPEGGIFVDNVETYLTRKNRILGKYLYPFNWLYYALDVLFYRVFPKLPLTKKIYFWMTKGRGRVLSKAETLGRLYSCGFEVLEEKYIGNLLYFAVRKTKQPAYDNNPTYGPIIRLKRHGKDGKLFNVYKLRTMHAYSEYLQEYVFKKNNLQQGGKFRNDFRITTEGRFFRKFWLDELPMFINLLKGNMKLVGVRPLSSHYFNLYSEELKEKRIRFKPGLIPPFYADLPETLEEIMASEMKYLEAYEKNPLLTDIRYFFKAWQNILFKKARSN